MSKFVAAAALAAAFFAPGLAQADPFERGMNTMWEVLWHQSGTATRLVRWEQDLKVRIHGVEAAAYRQHTLQALRDVAAEAGLKVIDVSDRADAAQLANVDVEILGDHALSEHQPCETRLNFESETVLQSASLKMRAGDALRCAYHESMHVMGVRGHPEGDTVLSYFTPHSHSLLPLDKAMLRAWYSPRARGGMTPFEVLPLLADQLVLAMPDRAKALQARDRFLARTFAEMQAFAEGRGDVPAIVKRTGKSSEQGIRHGRMEMSYFLAIAYEQGNGVPKDADRAGSWLRRAASLGNRNALVRLGAGPAVPAGSVGKPARG
jgi:hypothetical protein